MPNWCENELEVTGPSKEVVRFKAFAKSKTHNLDFNKAIPYPRKFAVKDKAVQKLREAYDAARDKAFPDGIKVAADGKTSPAYDKWYKTHPYPMKKDGFNSGGYEWCSSNWGTKWNSGDARVSVEGVYKALHYEFDTAWNQPTGAINAFAAKFPKLKFVLTYDEPGMCFKGQMTWENGRLVAESYEEYGADQEEEE